jgi:hypothetical protein
MAGIHQGLHRSGKISVFARQREIARTRESATAAEGGTHVYLNSKMVQVLLAEMGESPAPRSTPSLAIDLSSFLTRPVVTDASFHQGLDILQAFKLNGL